MTSLLIAVKTFIILPIISYAIPITTACIGFGGGMYMGANRLEWNFNLTKKNTSTVGIAVATDLTISTLELFIKGLPLGLIGMILGIISGTFLKSKFDSR